MPCGWNSHDSGTEYGRQLERERREKAARDAKAAEDRAAIDRQLTPAGLEAATGSVPAMRTVIELLAKKHGFTIETRTVMPEGASAFANWSTRTIVIPPIVDEDTYAVALHETGHILAGKCSRREPHRPDPSVTNWHHCNACEIDAWRIAVTLVPFSMAMHARGAQSLRTYRRTTPAAAAVIDRLDETAGTVFFREEQLKRRRWQDRIEREERVARELAREVGR